MHFAKPKILFLKFNIILLQLLLYMYIGTMWYVVFSCLLTQNMTETGLYKKSVIPCSVFLG